MQLRKKAKGITIAETVVAIAVIVTVSIAAVSVINLGLKFAKRAENRGKAGRDAINALEYFKYASDASEFETALFSVFPREGVTIENDEGNKRYSYVYEAPLTIEICVNFGDPGVEGDRFSAECLEQNGERVFYLDYTKG